MTAQVSSYPPQALVGFPPYMQAPQPSTCDCHECRAWLAQQHRVHPHHQAQSTYTHSPYNIQQPPAMPIQPEAHQDSHPEVNVVPRKRKCSYSDTSSHSSRDNSLNVNSHRDTTVSPGAQSPEAGRQGGHNQVSVAAIHRTVGRVFHTACNPHGSSFLQSALNAYPIEGFEVIASELEPVMARVFQDKNACYVGKVILEMMDKPRAIRALEPICKNEELLVSLCTKDLHSRRMIQFLLDFLGAERSRFLYHLVMRRSLQIVRTQQGCITLQRILDHFSIHEKEEFFDLVRSSFMEYALDPFGNYIIQYMLTEGNQVANSNTLALFCRGQLHNMVCHKYASNVVEKCFGLVTPELQHEIIEELFIVQEPALLRLLTDSNANYVVQAAIRSASYRDVCVINDRVSPLLHRVPYGKKLQKRLSRRISQ